VTYPISDDIVDVADCKELRSETIREMWLRLLIPPPVRRDFDTYDLIPLLTRNNFYTDDLRVYWCANQILHIDFFARSGWSEQGLYLLTLLLSCAGAMNTAVIVWPAGLPAGRASY
jgi:hypothetical protein